MTTIEDDDEEFDDLLGEDDEWEDEEAYNKIIERMPNGWYMIKITNFTAKKLRDIAEWCSTNMIGEYKEVNWRTGCAYSVAMQFAESKDAVLFKLMWS